MAIEGNPALMTLEEWKALPFEQQGYVHYMQSAWPGSPLPKTCPYEVGSMARKRFEKGEFKGILAAQECDD